MKTCATCGNPFPEFVEGSTEARCFPCRKRATGEPLTKSDLAYDWLCDWVSNTKLQRETGWRNRLDALEAASREKSMRIAVLECDLALARSAASATGFTVPAGARAPGVQETVAEVFRARRAESSDDPIGDLDREEVVISLKRQLAALQDTIPTLREELEMTRRQVRGVTKERDTVAAERDRQGMRIRQLEAELSRVQFANFFGKNAAASGPQLDRAFVAELIKLCHPDRHGGNSEAANVVTARLLNLRKDLPK